MLGLCTLHLLARAVAEYYKVKKRSEILCCDNKCAPKLSSHHQCRICLSAKCANIRHMLSLKITKQTFMGTFRYVHVYGHMDRYLKWEQLTLTQGLNCVYDMLAKTSFTTAITQGYHNRQSQLLPNKDVALIIWGNKITGNTLSPLQLHASKEVGLGFFWQIAKGQVVKQTVQLDRLGTFGPGSQEQGGYVQDVVV